MSKFSTEYLPFRDVEVQFDKHERARLRAGELADDDSEVAYGLACFAAWVSGKGFTRASWMVQHTELNRGQRNQIVGKLSRAQRMAKCRFCRRKVWRGHAKNCKGMLVANGIACFVKWATEQETSAEVGG